jgi:kynurenine formamidase
MRKNRQSWSMLAVLLSGVCFASLAACAQQADSLARVFGGIQSGQIEVVELSHPLDENSPYWPEGNAPSPFRAKVVSTIENGGYFARDLEMPEHFGTHMDAPAHFDAKGLTIDRIPVTQFLRAAIVIDVREQVKSNSDYRIAVDDLKNWEKGNGAIPSGCVVLFRTGWSSRWPSQKDYMNQDANGVLHFPGLSLEAARYLLDRAHPAGIGIDTGSIDYGPSQNFEVHHLTMSAGLYHLENLANLDRLPARGAYVVALPMKLTAGSGSPTRVMALLSRQRSGKQETRN